MSDFTCPKCGGHYFGRDTINGVALPLVRCHGQSSSGKEACDWRGEWPRWNDMDNVARTAAMRDLLAAAKTIAPGTRLRRQSGVDTDAYANECAVFVGLRESGNCFRASIRIEGIASAPGVRSISLQTLLQAWMEVGADSK